MITLLYCKNLNIFCLREYKNEYMLREKVKTEQQILEFPLFKLIYDFAKKNPDTEIEINPSKQE